MPPIIHQDKCSGCATCVDICPMQVLQHFPREDKVPRVSFPYECWHCNCCVLDCPEKAIELRIPVPFMMLHVDAKSLSRP